MTDPDNTPQHSNDPDPNGEKPKKSYFWLKVLFWFVVLCAASWYLQQLSPITINGVELSVPIS